ncbi:MAG: DUF4430 domain-containing protein [Oscillospiraceae bacterium]|nr:DUF4430 domain-containing protein [Oscillospiraceae bacterium]
MNPKIKRLIAVLIIVIALAASLLIQNGPVSKPSSAVPSNEAAYSAAEASSVPPSGEISQSEPPPLSTDASGQLNDRHNTSPKPEKPAATGSTAQTAAPETKTCVCSLIISCNTILDNMDKLAEGKETLIPSDGWLLSLKDVEFSEGDTAFDVLRRELIARNMHLEFSVSPIYNTVYIEGICNIYELDCGEMSGWMYTVNGVFPNVGCGEYRLSDGDAVSFVYTCDLGRDVGEASAA